jgi:hypothetical protein
MHINTPDKIHIYCILPKVIMDFVNPFPFKEKYSLIVCVYGSATTETGREQIRLVRDTWGKLCNIPAEATDIEGVSADVVEIVRNRVKLLFFLGEQPVSDEFARDDCVLLPNGIDDDLPSINKQYDGLRYVSQKYYCDFVMTCNTETYINVVQLLRLLDTYSPNDNLYIGGHGSDRMIGNNNYYFHSGEPGVILSYACLLRLASFLIGDIENDWARICTENGMADLIDAGDISIGFYVQQQNINASVVKVDGLRMNQCNHVGIPCHVGEIDTSRIISCHMALSGEFIMFHQLQSSNNFYIGI